MFYKLSTLATRKSIEEKFALKFKYPNLYRSQALIDGLEESSLPIITAEEANIINFSIWGLLPENFLGDWKRFQDTNNTLNFLWKDLLSEPLPILANTEPKRCLIIVSGFFTNKIEDGELKTYHIHLKGHEPFAMAGIYNKLEDGFYTCAPILVRTTQAFKNIPNFNGMKPLIFKSANHKDWLNQEKTLEDLKTSIHLHRTYSFLSHRVESKFYNSKRVFSEIANDSHFELL